jgi:import inner membrane translocase subunit TIM16
MTLDEAHLILNVKRGDSMETMIKVRRSRITPHISCQCFPLQHHDHLFKINSPPPKPDKPVAGKQAQIYHSHYLQSKVYRALERLEAETKSTSQEAAQESAEAPTTQPPPPPEAPRQGSGSP